MKGSGRLSLYNIYILIKTQKQALIWHPQNPPNQPHISGLFHRRFQIIDIIITIIIIILLLLKSKTII